MNTPIRRTSLKVLAIAAMMLPIAACSSAPIAGTATSSDDRMDDGDYFDMNSIEEAAYYSDAVILGRVAERKKTSLRGLYPDEFKTFGNYNIDLLLLNVTHSYGGLSAKTAQVYVLSDPKTPPPDGEFVAFLTTDRGTGKHPKDENGIPRFTITTASVFIPVDENKTTDLSDLVHEPTSRDELDRRIQKLVGEYSRVIDAENRGEPIPDIYARIASGEFGEVTGHTPPPAVATTR